MAVGHYQFEAIGASNGNGEFKEIVDLLYRWWSEAAADAGSLYGILSDEE